MSTKTLHSDPRVQAYLLEQGVREDALLQRLRAETSAMERGQMQISADTGGLLRWLVALTGATRCVEVGVFTGYSSVVLARAMGPSGRLIACDVSEEWTAIARRYWREADVDARIDLRLAPALQTLSALAAQGWAGQTDLIFIDADKESYPAYFEAALALLRPGGVLVADNTLWSGRVADPADQDAPTLGVRAFNALVHADARVDMVLLPMSDGITLVRRR